MAAAGRRTDDSVATHLLEKSYDFEFFQAVRLLLRLMPGRRPVGTASQPAEEVVRFGTRVSLEFPASAIYEIERNPPAGGPPRMQVTFLGLMGTQGAMPFHYTEQMLRQRELKAGAMEAFFNLFNHRWISLFYRAWEKHRLPVAYERAALETTAAGRISNYLFNLIGLGTPGIRESNRLKVPGETLLYFCGLFSQRPRNAANLRALLSCYFGVAVSVEQCVGAWYKLKPEDRCYLEGRGVRNQLGEGAVAGAEVWDQQSKFRMRLGPLNESQFRAFLPGGEGLEHLTALTQFFIGPTLAFEVQLVLDHSEVPWPCLSGRAATAPRLGWSSWLRTGEMGRDPDEAVFPMAS